MEIDLASVPASGTRGRLRQDTLLFSESSGRFILTVAPGNQAVFEKLVKGMACARVGRVTDGHALLTINGLGGERIVEIPLDRLESAWTGPLGDRI
jgi:phosphoribosylformylglycinamidine synthase